MTTQHTTSAGPLLTVEAAAERLSTSPRFIRRLIAERRIEFVKVGRHVRISEAALADFIESGKVAPLTAASLRSPEVVLWLGLNAWLRRDVVGDGAVVAGDGWRLGVDLVDEQG